MVRFFPTNRPEILKVESHRVYRGHIKRCKVTVRQEVEPTTQYTVSVRYVVQEAWCPLYVDGGVGGLAETKGEALRRLLNATRRNGEPR